MTFENNLYAQEQYNRYLKLSYNQRRPLTFSEARERHIDMDVLIICFGSFLKLSEQVRADFKEYRQQIAKEEQRLMEVTETNSTSQAPKLLKSPRGKYAQQRRIRRQVGDRRVKWSEETLKIALKELYGYYGGRPTQQQCREFSQTHEVPNWATLVSEFGPPKNWDDVIANL